MRSRTVVFVGVLLAAAAASLLASGRQPGGTQGNQDVLQALLGEVRGLRLAIEQMGAAGARVQLAMGRLQLQEQRVNTLLRRLDTVREQRQAVEREIAAHRADAARFEELSQDPATEAAERKAIDSQSRGLKAMAEQRTADLQRLMADEAEVGAAISAEQSRWSEVNRALEDLERTLTVRR